MPRVSPEHSAARRAQILDAAARCFSRSGFHCTKMPDIVREAGLSAGSIYNYFDSKDEIIDVIAKERHVEEQQDIHALIEDRETADALTVLTSVFTQQLDTASGIEQRRVAVFAWAEALIDENIAKSMREGIEGPRREIAALVESSNQTSERSRPLDPDATARVFIAMFHGFVLQALWDPDTPREAMIAVVADLIAALWPDSS